MNGHFRMCSSAAVAIFCLIFCAATIVAQNGLDPSEARIGPVVSTDKLDYQNAETISVTANGFHAYEYVTLRIEPFTDSQNGAGAQSWIVAADENGKVVSSNSFASSGRTSNLFRLSADCADGYHAETLFTVSGDSDRNSLLPSSKITTESLLSQSVTPMVLTASDTGWYSNFSGHSSGNKNYFVGGEGSSGQLRDYFVFNLAGVSGVINGATLRASNVCSSGPSHTYSLFDVTTSIANLEASHGATPSIFNDLGFGVQYASKALTASEITNGTTISVDLNAAGLSAIQNNLGTAIAIGGDYPGGSNDFILGCTGSPSQVQLVLQIGQNTAPTANVDSYSTDEDTPLTVPATGVLGNDADGESDPLTAVLVSNPSHASGFSINGDGSFNYTPQPDFNGTDSFSYKANDGQADSGVVTVTITVNPVNDAPMLSGVPASATVPELAAYNFAASASDVDLPPDTLTFSLTGAPAGATINPSTGQFSWTPTEAQGDGSTYNFSVNVSDGSLTASLPIGIMVTEVNSPPQISDVPTSATIDENAPYSFDANASDADLPANVLTFSLVGTVPSGSGINPSTGVFSWTPGESQGPGTYPFTVRVSDGIANSDAAINITVNEVNSSPVLDAIGDKTVNEQELLSFTVHAADSDDPANTLTYSLDAGAPAGMTINATSGLIEWTPGESDGPNNYAVTIRVTDNGAGNLADFEAITVHVKEVNVAPVLSPIGNSTVPEGQPFTFTASATDADLPANTLAYSVIGAPAGASIDGATGMFYWTPNEAQGGNPNTPYTFTVMVTDNGDPALSYEETITVTVEEVNSRPTLNPIGNQNGYWGNVFGFAASATDPDIPANTLTFTLSGTVPAGASISPAGAFSWTPSISQVGSFTFNVVVIDNGTPQLSDSKSVTITVGKRPTALVYTGDGSEQYSDQQTLSAVLTDAGGGAMNASPIPGRNVGFAIGSQSTSASTGVSGIASLNLIVTQDPALVYTVASSFAGDALYIASGDIDPFDITQEDARAYYTGSLFSSTACTTCSGAAVTLSVTIRDITAEAGDPAFDSFDGDIRKATVTFVNRDAGNAPIVGCSDLPVGLANTGDMKTGTATCSWNVNIGSADSADFTIGVVLGNYYTRNASTEDSLLTVSKPLGTNFITGGGYVVSQGSAGQTAGAVGLKSNFGFNVKYNSSGKNLQGRVNVIVRGADNHVYQIKGNSMTSLSANNSNPLSRTAVFNGKANITDITNPLNTISLGGNMTLQMNVTDRGEPGNSDSIAITVWDNAGGLWYSSNWNGMRTVEQVLGGGNLLVR